MNDKNAEETAGCCGSSEKVASGCCPSTSTPECGPSSPVSQVQKVPTELDWADRLGGLKVRLNIRRMEYTVAPGLYAIGHPTPDSSVFVSANYKLSFDCLRRELGGLDAWILVLDTDGINVWCAAGVMRGATGASDGCCSVESDCCS